MSTPKNDNLQSVTEAAAVSGLSAKQVRTMCRAGKIPAQMVGKTYVIPGGWAEGYANTVSTGVAALAAGVSRQTVYAAISEGKLSVAATPGAGNRIAMASLADYIRGREGGNWSSKPYVWGAIYACMLDAVSSCAPELLHGYEKHEQSYAATPGAVFPVLHGIYLLARKRGQGKTQEKAAAEFRLTLLMSVLAPEDFKRRLSLEEQSDVSIGVYRNRRIGRND